MKMSKPAKIAKPDFALGRKMTDMGGLTERPDQKSKGFRKAFGPKTSASPKALDAAMPKPPDVDKMEEAPTLPPMKGLPAPPKTVKAKTPKKPGRGNMKGLGVVLS
jgi:hypothetical protein